MTGDVSKAMTIDPLMGLSNATAILSMSTLYCPNKQGSGISFSAVISSGTYSSLPDDKSNVNREITSIRRKINMVQIFNYTTGWVSFASRVCGSTKWTLS